MSSVVPPININPHASKQPPTPLTEEEEDIYAALDELRVLTKYSIDSLTMFHRWYCNYVNPRQSPALHGASIEQFAATFRNASPDNPTVLALFKRFRRPNGVADMLEVFAGMCVICDGTTTQKVDFLFQLFDFASKGNIVEDEATLMLECVAGAFSTIGLIVMPEERDLEFASGWIYTDRITGETRGAANVDDFRTWVTNSPAAGEILEMLNCVPVVEELLDRFHHTVTEFVKEITGNNTIDEDAIQDDGKNWLGIDGGFDLLSDVKYRDDVRLLVGPIIGTVTSCDAIVLLEVDRDAEVSVLICLAGGYNNNDIALLPPVPNSLGNGPSRTGGTRERLVRIQKMTLQSCRPRSIKITGLSPNAIYRIHIGGVTPDDSATRVGSFRTLRESNDGHSGSSSGGNGIGSLLQSRYYRNRYHMQNVEDRDTYGGVATGPMEEGLTVVVVSGEAQRTTPGTGAEGKNGRRKRSRNQMSNTKGNQQEGKQQGEDEEEEEERSRDTSADQNETSLWKTLWNTTVRPSRCDLVIHAGGQISMKNAVKKADVLFRRYLRDDEGSKDLDRENNAIDQNIDFIQTGHREQKHDDSNTKTQNKKLRGKRAQQALETRENEEQERVLRIQQEKRDRRIEDDQDHMQNIHTNHPTHPHHPPPTTPRYINASESKDTNNTNSNNSNSNTIISNDSKHKGDGNDNDTNQMHFHDHFQSNLDSSDASHSLNHASNNIGGFNFSNFTDDITLLLKHETDLFKREQLRKALKRGVHTADTKRVVHEYIMEMIRDTYRRSYNLMYTRECLAHVSNIMCLGKEDITVNLNVTDGATWEENQQKIQYRKLLERMCRRGYWEYQRQLWDVDCVQRSDAIQKRKERRIKRRREKKKKNQKKKRAKEKKKAKKNKKKMARVKERQETRQKMLNY